MKYIPEIEFNDLPNPLQDFIKEEWKKHNKLLEDFIYSKLWLFKKLPKCILKRLYRLEIKRDHDFRNPKTIYTLKNKLTRKKYTYIIEYETFTFNEK